MPSPTCPGALALVLDNLAPPPPWAQVDTASIQHGGENVAAVLRAHGVRFLFTLVGGHISPLLVACEKLGIRVVDTRHEVTAVFAADAVARLTGEGRTERSEGWGEWGGRSSRGRGFFRGGQEGGHGCDGFCVSGTVGVAAVTAGPGLTNTVTAVKNAQIAQSPVLLLGGAASTLLQVPCPWWVVGAPGGPHRANVLTLWTPLFPQEPGCTSGH